MKQKLLTYFLKNDQGGILIITLVVFSSLVIIGFSISMLLSMSYKKAVHNTWALKANYLAEAGIERAAAEFLLYDDNRDWSDDQFKEIYEAQALGNGVYSVRSKQANTNSIIITATGEYRGVKRQVSALLVVDWDEFPSALKIRQWQELEGDSLTLIN